MAQIGSLSVKLGLVTAEWDKATDKAKQQAKDLQKAFDELGGGLKKLTDLWKMLGGAIGVGSIGLVGLIQQTAEYADKIDDLSKAFGVSAGFALQFSNALEQAGVSADNASKAMTTLFTNIESAREGNQEAVDLFRKMGIGFNDIKQMQPEQAIRKVVDSLADLQKSNPIAYVQELRKNLGRGGIGLDAEQVNDILKNGIDKWNNYGERLEKVSRIHDNLKQSYNNLLIAFSDFIAPFTRDGVVAVEKFTGALAGMFTYLVATRIASAAVAMWEIVTALRAAATAGAAFNIVAAGNPIGLLLSLAAAGTAFLVYQKESGRGTETVGEISYDPMGNPISSGTASITGGGTANKPSVATPSTSESTSTTGEYTPKELSSFAQLAAEKFKTMNAQIMASIPVWNTFAQKVIGIQTEADVAIKNIAAKRQEAMATYKTSPVLLEAELGKLREQEKQIKINRDRKIEEAQTTESIYNVEQMRLVNLAYFEGRISNTVALTQRQLATNQALLQIEQTRIRNETELSLLALQTKSTLDDSVKAIIAENINFSATIDLLKNELNSLPEYIDLPADMLSQEAEANNRRIEALKAQIDLETKRHDLRMAYFQQERTFEYGMTMAVNQLVDNATNHAKLARSMVDSVFSNMTNAIDAFVKTGKFSFYDFRKSVIQDLIAIQMKAQTISILKSVWSAATSLTVGTSTGPDNIDVGGGWNPARAEGGPVDSGKIGLVGEKGPELFVPKVPGTIIPNNQLGNIGGSTTINNYNINAIDAKSFEERLYESSRAIWAANQYATKNLATNRSRT
jgi:lambda family phage tail tape measure protein